MERMTRAKARQIIRKNLQPYRDALNLGEWEITTYYMDEENPDAPLTGMMIDTDISYLRAQLRVYPALWKNEEEDEIKRMIVHELCHIITEPMYSLCRANVNPHLYPFVEEQREQETERIARIAHKVLGIA